jgi:hypothetical protein
MFEQDVIRRERQRQVLGVLNDLEQSCHSWIDCIESELARFRRKPKV